MNFELYSMPSKLVLIPDKKIFYLNGRQSSIPALQEDLDTVRIWKKNLMEDQI